MWVLECETDCLRGRTVWLKPGKQYLFGRTKASPSRYQFIVDRPSISRQHITLSVRSIPKNDSADVTRKTGLILKDEGSKFGTEIDGIKVTPKSETTLSHDLHTIRLGKASDLFRVRWVPVVLTFSLASKDYKAQDPLLPQRNRIEDSGLDVKVSLQYSLEATTHVVAGKRNTAKGLSALILGKHIVTERFIDAIIAAATPTDLDKAEEVSHLEDDFNKYWPNAAEYLPERGKEPIERPAQDYLPTSKRGSVFEGYTFIFCDQAQFDSLQTPISHGGGKALHCVVQPGSTTPEEVVRYVKTAAGEKGLGELEDGSEGKGVVVVRLARKEKHAEWATRIDMEVAQALDHRLIEQSEFLNAVLSNDASMLRKPLLPEDYNMLEQNGVRSKTVSMDIRQDTCNSMSTIRSRREPVVSRFKGFVDDSDDDNDEDDNDARNTASAPTQNSTNHGLTASSAKSQAVRRFDSSEDSEEQEAPVQDGEKTETRNPRKRQAPDDHDQADQRGSHPPQQNARKRQKQVAAPAPESEVEQVVPSAASVKAKSKQKSFDVKAAVQGGRKEAEDEAEADRAIREDIHEILENMTVEEMQSLAVVEEVELLEPRSRGQPTANGSSTGGPEWNDAWNGRKNFKKFRRKGAGERASIRDTDRIIVGLEAAKTKDFGIGEDYWLENEPEDTSKRRRKGDKGTQSQSQSASNRTPHTASVPSELVMDTGDTHVSETIDLDAPRTTRREQYSTTESGNRASQSQVLAENSAARNQQVPSVTLPARKRKKFAAADDSEESDHDGVDDDDSIRFTKRVRGRR